MPQQLVTQEGRAGMLLDMKPRALPRDFTMLAGEVRLVTVKELLPAELAYLQEHGKKGRDKLLRRFDRRATDSCPASGEARWCNTAACTACA